jgi:hypothetical protein
MPAQNQPNPGGMFSRYQGESINQIPAGYVEGMSSWGRAAQSLGSNIANMMAQNRAEEQNTKTNTLKTGENAINERKVAAAERANVIKEGQADTEATYKAYTAVLAADEAGYKRAESSSKAIDAQIQYYKNVQGDATASPADKEAAGKKILELTPLKTKAMEGLARYLSNVPPSYETFLTDRKKAGADRPGILRHPNGDRNMMQDPKTLPNSAKPEDGSTSYYTSPFYNPASVTGEKQGVTKTVAYGGSAKKVELVGGRVSSVTSPTGKKTVIGSFLPEEHLDGATEFAEASYDASDTEDPHPLPQTTTEEPAAPTTLERTEVPGPLGNKMVEIEPMKAIESSMTASVPVNGTIIFEKTTDSAGTVTKTPRIMFNSRTLVNADGTPNETGYRTQRQLALINEVLKGGSHKLVKPSQEERDSARDLFGVPENAFDLPEISAAWAVVKRNTDQTYKGFDPTANNFSMSFQQTFGMYPSQFLVNGEQANQEEIIADANVALEATATARLASRFESIGSAPQKPIGLQESIDNVGKQLLDTEQTIAKLSKWLANPLIAGSDTETAYKNQLSSEMKKLTVIQAKAQQNQIMSSNYDIDLKAYESKRNAVEQELKVDKLAQDLATGRVEQSKAVSVIREGWIGTEPEHAAMTNGFIASKLKTIKNKTGAIPMVDKDGQPIMTVDRFGNRVQKTYQDRLDAPELMAHLLKTKRYDIITTLSSGMPNADNIANPKTGILDAQFKYNEALKPIRELKSMNDKYVALAASGLTGEAKSYWNRMWYEASDAAGTTYQKTLIGKIREAIVGPGNPSNYEQEVIASIVPNPTDVLTRPERQKARIKALAAIAILNHYNRMLANKLESTPETFKMYSEQLGDVLGFPVTEEFFTGMRNDYTKSRQVYANNEAIGNENKSIATDYANRLLDTLEARGAPAKTPAKK